MGLLSSFWVTRKRSDSKRPRRRKPRSGHGTPRLEPLEDRLAPANITWTDAAGDHNWSNPGNWQGHAVPTSSDVATFNGGVSNDASTIDSSFNVQGINILSNYTGTITLSVLSTLTLGASGYTQYGGTFGMFAVSTLQTSGYTQYGGTFSGGLGCQITVGGFFDLVGGSFTNSDGTLTLNGDFFNAGSFTSSSAVFAGSTPQTFFSTSPVTFNKVTVNNGPGGSVALGSDVAVVPNQDPVVGRGDFLLTAGSLTTASHALTVGGNFTVNGGSVAQADVPQVGGNLTVNGGSVDLAADTTVAGNVLLTGGALTLEGHTLTLKGNFTNNASPTAFGGGTVAFTGTAAQTIGGSAATTFNNLTVNNGFGGSVTLAPGANPTLTGSLSLSAGSFSVGSNTLTVDGDFTNNAGSPAFNAGTGTVVFAGSGAATLGGSAGTTFSNLTVSKAASGGSVTLAASTTVANAFALSSGTVVLGVHTLTLQGDFFNNAGPAAFNGAGGSVIFAGNHLQRLGGSSATTFDQLTYSGGLTLRLETSRVTARSVADAAGSTIDLNGTDLATGQVTGGGTVTESTGQGRLLMDTPVDTSLLVNLAGTVGLTKSGPGTLILLGTFTNTGPTIVAGGTLLVNGKLTQSSVTVGSGATLSGTGTVAAVTVAAGATVKPGVHAGTLTNTGGITFQSNSTFSADIDAYLPTGSQYDQLLVQNGSVDLGGSNLTVNLKAGVTPPTAAQFTLISNPAGQPVQGTFAGLPEGGVIVVSGLAFQITYRGGSGHDVVLTRSSEDVLFIKQVYQDLLHRQADDGGISYWTGLLSQGLNRPQVVLAIENTTEYRSLLVGGYFQKYLRRPADAGALNFFDNALASGATHEQVLDVVLGSDEYLQRATDGTPAGYAVALFRDLFNWTVDPAQLGFFTEALLLGAGRVQVADLIVNSDTNRQVLVQDFYSGYLHHGADDNGLTFWSTALKLGARDDEVLALIAGSDEYLQRL